MEALIAVLVEPLLALVTMLFAPLGALLAEGAAALLQAIVGLIGLATGRARRPAAGVPATSSVPHPAPFPPAPPRRRRWRRRLAIATGAVIAGTLLLIWMAQTFWADAIVGWALDRHRQRTGIAIAAERVELDAFAGRVVLAGVRVRGDDGRMAYDLTADRVEIDAEVLALLRGRRRCSLVAIDGVRGSWRCDLSATKPARLRSPLEVAAFTVRDAEVAATLVRDGRSVQERLRIAHWCSAPLRTHRLLFDLLYRSDAEGAIGPAAFTLATGGDDRGRWTSWRADGVPAAWAGTLAGGPLARLRRGSIDVAMDDRWSGEPPLIDLDWRVRLAGIDQPGDETPAGPVERAVARWLERHPDAWLRARLRVDPETLGGEASFDAQALWAAVAPALATELAERTGIDAATVRAAAGAGIGLARDALDRWRRREPPPVPPQ